MALQYMAISLRAFLVHLVLRHTVQTLFVRLQIALISSAYMTILIILVVVESFLFETIFFFSILHVTFVIFV